MGSEGNTELLLVMESFAIGGVAAFYSALGREAVRRGHSVTAIACSGDSLGGQRWSGIRTIAPDRLDRAFVSEIVGALRPDPVVLWQAAPSTAPLTALLLNTRRVVIALHGSPPIMTSWLATDDLDMLRAVARDNPGVVFGVVTRAWVNEFAALLEVPEDRVRWIPPVTSPADPRYGTGAALPAPREVLCPTRLSEEKRFGFHGAVRVATELGVPVHVIGTGPDEPWFREHVAMLGNGSRLTRNVDLFADASSDHVVVAVGLVALEAIMRGLRTVAVSFGNGMPIDLVTDDNWLTMLEGNFVRSAETADIATIARRIVAATPDDLSRVRVLALRDTSPDRVLDVVLQEGHRPAPMDRPPSDVMRRLAQSYGDAADERTRLREWAQGLVEARDFYAAQAEHLEAELADVRARLAECERTMDLLHRSLSWRLTRPLRAARERLGRRRGADTSP